MRTKRVNRYWCDHCNKGGCSAGAMAKHEKRCCHNPARVCAMCLIVHGIEPHHTETPSPQESIDVLIAALKDGGVPALREKAQGCPACILAAIIQNRKRLGPGEPDEDWYFKGEFDFKKERDAMWSEVNFARSNRE